MKNLIYMVILCFVGANVLAQTEKSVEGNVDNLPVREYTITINEAIVNKAGKEVKGMTINGSIPGPVLEFTEGEYAVIYVKNEMSVETSIHWHGLLLPNFYDGVPYLNTPPIEPGHTLKYEFALKQSGTYWYHSHTLLQEQSGVFGSFIIHPKKKTLEYDKELVLMLSDWTNEDPMHVLRNLKRGNEWYGIRKGTATPLNQVISRGAFGAQLNFWRQRMEGADIADVYYPAFLVNGEESIEYPEFKPGEKVRLRIINGGASTSFWMTFGGKDPLLISADGIDVEPVKKNKTFIGIAETYDYIVTIPQEGKVEFKIMAQDGSGTASAFFGNGKILAAKTLPRPDKIGMMKEMAKMDMKMGAHALKYRPSKDERFQMKDEYGMQMKGDAMGAMKQEGSKMVHSKMKMDNMKMQDPKMDHSKMKMDGMKMQDPKMDHSKMKMNNMKTEDQKIGDTNEMGGMDLFSEYNYDFLKSPEKTAYGKDVPVKEILLNLTGNMQRYIWSMNGVPLSETDNIKIEGDQVTRITLNNLTMMHHPMHLHGHFFRVLNENGEYSPLKHTVNVPPMQAVTIEFYGNEYGDWFFHCHILYHLMGGMARVMSYDTPPDARMKEFPASIAVAETDLFYSWGMVDASSQNTTMNLVASNLRNQFNATVEYGYNENLEAEFTYERYLHDYLRVFGGVNIENEIEDSFNEFKTVAVAGIRFLTPYLFNLDARIDSDLRPRVGIGRNLMLFPKFSVFGYYEYQLDFGWVNSLPTGINSESETVWSAGAEYFLSRNVSLVGSYDNRFGGGGGLSIRF
ncbi:multicopper oxidase domain-containing protein [Maribacter sp. 4G9]|uniref:multicopper oxidase domain-containing protein n=1 Tax=Maribacter sp. 4G9 TaxID=1889777 RepID=UPI000C14F815|nr:multicopper oxidase domain-containing protein [Maribacter sp. 4G9]PIB38568.1 copper oxidase [Maribacter sp. 4G9]